LNLEKRVCIADAIQGIGLRYTHRTLKFGAFTPSPAGEGWGEEILKSEF